MHAQDVIEISDPRRLVAGPVVSVLMITYNHACCLADAIDGVLSQRCSFPFELLIGEDASSDKTLEIALDYQARFPEIIRVIHSHANVGMLDNARRVLERSRGEFVAYCEGDDFWCATDKLQRQVELMQADPGIGVVHTDWVKSRYTQDGWRVDWKHSAHRRVPRRYLEGDLFEAFYNPKILRTCTRLARREVVAACFQSPLGQASYGFGDTVGAAFATASWRVGYLPQVTAVYRMSPRSALRSGVAARIRFLRSALRFDTDARAYFAERADYPAGYRWELAMGLLLWGVRARDFRACRDASRDIRAHFTLVGFVRHGWKAVLMRLPGVLATHRRTRGRAA
jgi:glycosyltransferase involved in cell wall biosynthesis